MKINQKKKNISKNLSSILIALFCMMCCMGCMIYTAMAESAADKDDGSAVSAVKPIAGQTSAGTASSSDVIDEEPSEKALSGTLMTFISSVSEQIQSKVSILSDAAGKSIFLSNSVFSLYGKLERLMGKRVSYDKLYITCMLDNGYLSYANKYIDMSQYVTNLNGLSEYLKQKDIGFLFVLNPSKSDGTEDMFPDGITDYYPEVKQQLIKGMDENGISYMVMADELSALYDEDICSLFFKTDHHWHPTTGVYAAKEIAEELNADYGYDFDLGMFDIENFNTKTYEDYFLGSQGKKIGVGYIDPEDFDLVTPNFDTAFYVGIPSLDFNGAGDYSETLINMNVFDDDYDYADDNAYGAYLYGDRPMIRIQNRNCNNGKRILIVKTSLANVVAPVLACGEVQFVDVIDLRIYKESLRDFIDESQPDTVIVMNGLPYYAINLTSSGCSWNFE